MINIENIVSDAKAMQRAVARATSYTDYIAHVCKTALGEIDPDKLIDSTGPIQHDLHPVGRYSLSTKKTLMVEDRNGNHYRVTIEDVR